MTERPKILIADDDTDILTLLRIQLERAGFQMFEAHDGYEAIKITRREKPVIVILDWMMPEMDGIEACQQIREESKQVYIIMLSAVDDDEQQAEALEAGANDYRTKPMKGKQLILLLQEILAGSI